MRKSILLIVALALSGLAAFWMGRWSRDHRVVEAQADGRALFPKVEIDVRIDGIREPFSAGLSGLGGQCEVIEFRDGDDVGQEVRKIPGRLKWNDITLKRSFVKVEEPVDSALYEWFSDVKQGDFTRKDGSITLRTAEGTEIATYQFFEAWPCKWKGFSAPNAAAAFPSEEAVLVVGKVQEVRR